MKNPDQERLLSDVLNEDEAYNTFRAELRQTMLAEVRRRRHSRRTKPLMALAACVAFALMLLWLVVPRGSNNRQPGNVTVVRSVPLRLSQIVTTAAHKSNFAVVHSRIEVMSANFQFVRTLGRLPPDTLTDEQLLQLFGGRAVALVNSTSGKKLVFLDQDAQPEANP